MSVVLTAQGRYVLPRPLRPPRLVSLEQRIATLGEGDVPALVPRGGTPVETPTVGSAAPCPTRTVVGPKVTLVSMSAFRALYVAVCTALARATSSEKKALDTPYVMNAGRTTVLCASAVAHRAKPSGIAATERRYIPAERRERVRTEIFCPHPYPPLCSVR